MKLVRGFLVAFLVGCGVSEARAQLGMYGSPEPLPFLAQQPAAPSQPAYGPTAAAYVQPYDTVAEGQPSLRPAVPPPPGIMPAAPNAVPPATPPGYGAPTPAYGVPTPAYTAPGYSLSGPSTLGPMDMPPGGVACGAGGMPSAPAASVLPGGYGLGCCATDCPWYVSVYGLGMTRDRPNKLYTTAQTNDLDNQWGDNHFDWTGGGEIRVGRTFCCGQWAIEGDFWGLSEFNTSACPDMAGPYSTPFTMHLVSMLGTTGANGGCTTADEWFDAASQQRIQRTDEVENAEINLWRLNLMGGGCGGCGGCGAVNGCGACGPLSIDALVGFRFFRFRDRLVYSSQHGEWDANGNPDSPYCGDWATLNDEISNNLWGVQVGFNAQYRVCNCLKVFVTPKVGIYDNYMTLDYNLYAQGANGAYYQGASQTYNSPCYPVHSTGNGFSVLSQIDVGLNWDISCRWEATLGYRLVGVTGMGLADNQVPFYGNDTPAVACIDKNGSLILHGVFGGLTFRF